LREWGDALVVAYLLAMFIRMFVVELFKIPSPSMTPTLLGTEMPRNAVGFYDTGGDGEKDMILHSGSFPYGQMDVFRKETDAYVYDGVLKARDPKTGKTNPKMADILRTEERLARHPQARRSGLLAGLGQSLSRLWPGNSPERKELLDLLADRITQRQDRILVGKFLYWFSQPERGDIVVFKTPPAIYRSDKPIYIKRVVGLPGETLTFEQAPGSSGHMETMGYLLADGKRVESPSFFTRQRYQYRGIERGNLSDKPEYASYLSSAFGTDLTEARVPDDGVYVFGDNTVSSLDSRYWGKVSLDRLRGRALFRYNPRYFPYTKAPGFLK